RPASRATRSPSPTASTRPLPRRRAAPSCRPEAAWRCTKPSRCRSPAVHGPFNWGGETGRVSTSALPAWIDLDGAYNVRDLGGLPARDGVTRSGVLLRADALDTLTEADVARLVDELSLPPVFDLRSHAQRGQRGRGGLGGTGVVYSELEVISNDDVQRRRDERFAAFASGGVPEEILALGYIELLELGGPAFATALARLVEPGGTPALVHCAAG